jgi:hypothetical protein
MIKAVLIILGTISLGLGILGIFIPGLPTTPFILLTACLYLRSSDRLYGRLLQHPVTGRYLMAWKSGISRKARLISLVIMWVMILLAVVWVIHDLKWKILLIVIGLAGSAFKMFYRS